MVEAAQQQELDPSKKALKKYRRLRTIVNKADETANGCDVMINVIVYDPKMHRLREHYSAPEVRLSNISELFTKELALSGQKKKKGRSLFFQSTSMKDKGGKQSKCTDLPDLGSVF